MPETPSAAADDRMMREIEFVRGELDRGQSDLQKRVFDYLVRSLHLKHALKEIEIAHELFGPENISAESTSVRVHLHRLRRRLDAIYAARPGPRLQIPLGNYRLVLVDEPNVPASSGDDHAIDVEVVPCAMPVGADVPPDQEHGWRRPGKRGRVVVGAMAILAVAAAAWFVLLHADGPPASSSLWTDLGAGGKPTLIVAGDYYMFAQLEPNTQVYRLIRDYAINSREDLDRYLSVHPDDQGRFGDVDLHYVPTSVASAIGSLAPGVTRGASAIEAPMRVVSMSSTTPELLKENSVIFVGLLSGLGLLQEPVFSASGFRVGSSYDELVDVATGKRYESDWSNVLIDQTPRHDYAYIASVPGPNGNRTMVIAGMRDAGLRQAGEIAADPAQIRSLLRHVGGAKAFEALYETRTLGNTNLGSRLVVARPLKHEPAKAIYN